MAPTKIGATATLVLTLHLLKCCHPTVHHQKYGTSAKTWGSEVLPIKTFETYREAKPCCSPSEGGLKLLDDKSLATGPHMLSSEGNTGRDEGAAIGASLPACSLVAQGSETAIGLGRQPVDSWPNAPQLDEPKVQSLASDSQARGSPAMIRLPSLTSHPPCQILDCFRVHRLKDRDSLCKQIDKRQQNAFFTTMCYL